ncbi:MAG TPA: DUF4845 domain-containing protein, partial [Gammaproteobacteria bacterium]|nr:DUF4845 domain-containing protein [Gammaproteobacteria bacterium]
TFMLRRQAGITLIGGILVLIIAGILVLAAVKIVPLYFEAAKLGSVMKSVGESARGDPLGDLRGRLAEQLTINSIDDVPLNQFRFSSQGDQLVISLDHDLKATFIGNLGFVVHYRHSVTVSREGDD